MTLAAGTGVPEKSARRRQSTEIPDKLGVLIAQQQQPHSGLLIRQTLIRYSNFQWFGYSFPTFLLRIGTWSHLGNVWTVYIRIHVFSSDGGGASEDAGEDAVSEGEEGIMWSPELICVCVCPGSGALQMNTSYMWTRHMLWHARTHTQTAGGRTGYFIGQADRNMLRKYARNRI